MSDEQFRILTYIIGMWGLLNIGIMSMWGIAILMRIPSEPAQRAERKEPT